MTLGSQPLARLAIFKSGWGDRYHTWSIGSHQFSITYPMLHFLQFLFLFVFFSNKLTCNLWYDWKQQEMTKRPKYLEKINHSLLEPNWKLINTTHQWWRLLFSPNWRDPYLVKNECFLLDYLSDRHHPSYDVSDFNIWTTALHISLLTPGAPEGLKIGASWALLVRGGADRLMPLPLPREFSRPSFVVSEYYCVYSFRVNQVSVVWLVCPHEYKVSCFMYVWRYPLRWVQFGHKEPTSSTRSSLLRETVRCPYSGMSSE